MEKSYLLDTHALIWFLSGSRSLPSTSKKIILSVENLCFISIASIWEIAIKQTLGKIELNISFSKLREVLMANNISILPLEFELILELTKLEYVHRAPFDRIIIAQAITEKIALISKDEHFSKYTGLNLIWK